MNILESLSHLFKTPPQSPEKKSVELSPASALAKLILNSPPKSSPKSPPKGRKLDLSTPFQIEVELVKSALTKHTPKNTGNETNGSWFVYDTESKISAVYKPRLQARGAIDSTFSTSLRKGIPPGQEAIREKLACTLQSALFPFGIPETEIVSLDHPLFGNNHKVGSFQKFVPNAKSLTEVSDTKIPASELEKIALLDLISLNCDRHLDNILVVDKKCYPIDHGACFPEVSGVHEVGFSWMHLAFAKKPLEQLPEINEKEILLKLYAASKVEHLKYPNENMLISTSALFVSLHALVLLQKLQEYRPTLSISDFARGYVKESVPICTIEHSTMKKQVLLDPTKSAKEFDLAAFCTKENLDIRRTYCTHSRKTVGGHFCTLIRKNFDALKKEMRSPDEFFRKFEMIESKIAVSITPELFKTVEELALLHNDGH